jgi:hypothetical protein
MRTYIIHWIRLITCQDCALQYIDANDTKKRILAQDRRTRPKCRGCPRLDKTLERYYEVGT